MKYIRLKINLPAYEWSKTPKDMWMFPKRSYFSSVLFADGFCQLLMAEAISSVVHQWSSVWRHSWNRLLIYWLVLFPRVDVDSCGQLRLPRDGQASHPPASLGPLAPPSPCSSSFPIRRSEPGLSQRNLTGCSCGLDPPQSSSPCRDTGQLFNFFVTKPGAREWRL